MEIQEIKIHQHGFVRLVDTMGSDGDIADAARVSYGKGTRAVSDNRNLIRYLLRHKHTSPIEMASVKFHLKLPIFVMRQLIRHRTASVNEYSGRYSVMSNDCYVPEIDYIQPQSQTNKQGRAGELSEGWKKKYKTIISDITSKTLIAYKLLVGDDLMGVDGLSRELSRIVLPVSNYTECYWKIDLHNFFHFCRLRMDSHAQQEIQDYAKPMYELVKPHFPIATEAFEDYSLGSKSFSRMEMNVLKYMFDTFAEVQNYSGYDGYCSSLESYIDMISKSEDLDFGLGKREWTELKEKLK
jgi:thymidylate synthase (FAD)